jgi:hypothetical protein
MAGVTHFERKDLAGRKKIHPSCPFCGKTFRTTPKTIFKSGGPEKYIESFREHMMNHLDDGGALSGLEDQIRRSLDAMGGFTVSVYDNC